jgi:hypothetical protein
VHLFVTSGHTTIGTLQGPRSDGETLESGSYNSAVARGWESKSVEEQQAAAGEKPVSNRRPMSSEEAASWREHENLRLSRQRVLQQLEASTNPRHRKQLQDSLAVLDEKLGKLEK